MTVDKLSIFDGEKKPGQRELPRVELTKELLDSVRHIEGFPIGSDEDIIRLSDPPYYTACPNPFIGEFIKKYGKPFNPETDTYHREPFAADVSEGKNDPIYNAHTYHTKVPHKAIMRYILHYTEPGDIVLDGFCGTGMTGVAAQLCGDIRTVESLGYRVAGDGTITEESRSSNDAERCISKLGIRRAILNDLSPAASFIAYNYNTPVDYIDFDKASRRIMARLGKDWGWMYVTLSPEYANECEHLASRLRGLGSVGDARALISEHCHKFGKTTSTIRSDVLICPSCSAEIVFWDVAVDKATGKVLPDFLCKQCNTALTKRGLERVYIQSYDQAVDTAVTIAKQVPVEIYYTYRNRRAQKKPDAFDLALLDLIESLRDHEWFPNYELPTGYNTEQPKISHGITNVHHFYTKRNLFTMAAFLSLADCNHLLFALTGVAVSSTRMYRYTPNYEGGGPLAGTLYVPSILREISCFDALERFVNKLSRVHKGSHGKEMSSIISVNSTTSLQIEGNSVDYIFTDPPFGGNIMYSELNFIWESWLKVFTNNNTEAVENKAQGKDAPLYQTLMERCFREYYRVLKPGRWLTVEFHNSQDRIWNLIQESILRAGFVIANVATLDKKQGTFKQITTTGAVKQDLVISAYKPSSTLEQSFSIIAGSEAGVWQFISNHLAQASKPVLREGVMEPVPERYDYLLFDRMISFHIQRGIRIPLGASEFYAGLKQRYSQRDGMFFLHDQAIDYDRSRAQVKRVEQLTVIITDEKSAIVWLRNELDKKKQTFGEIQPKFMKSGQPQRHEKMPDLQKILDQNFLKDEEGQWYVPDPTRLADLEKLREKDLLREFEEYLNTKGKIKVFRTEAVRAGFKQAWAARDFATIVSVAKKLPEAVLQEDSALLMYYDNARTILED